jgi:hypothetical protein
LQCELKGLHILATDGKKLICRDSSAVYHITVKFKRADIEKVRVKLIKKIPDATSIIASPTSIYAVLKNGDFVMPLTPHPQQHDIGKIVCMSTSGEIGCLGLGDTSITLIENGTLVQSFSSFRDKILCCACRASFDLAVVGASLTLFLISVSRRSITRVISFSDINPILVEITRGWGFIVIYEVGAGAQFIEVLTVNGDSIRKLKLSGQIDAWSTWCSDEGFDHLIICQKSGRIMIYEVFWLTPCYLPISEYRVKSVWYLPRLGIVFVGQADGHVEMIPHRGGT